MPEIFISYNHSEEDKKAVAAFTRKLRRAGIPYFLDDESIRIGDEIPNVIHDALRRASHVVAFLSPGSENSQWVPFEMGIAYSMRKKLVLRLLHSRMQIPPFLSNGKYMKNSKDEDLFIYQLGEDDPSDPAPPVGSISEMHEPAQLKFNYSGPGRATEKITATWNELFLMISPALMVWIEEEYLYRHLFDTLKPLMIKGVSDYEPGGYFHLKDFDKVVFYFGACGLLEKDTKENRFEEQSDHWKLTSEGERVYILMRAEQMR